MILLDNVFKAVENKCVKVVVTDVLEHHTLETPDNKLEAIGIAFYWLGTKGLEALQGDHEILNQYYDQTHYQGYTVSRYNVYLRSNYDMSEYVMSLRVYEDWDMVEQKFQLATVKDVI